MDVFLKMESWYVVTNTIKNFKNLDKLSLKQYMLVKIE